MPPRFESREGAVNFSLESRLSNVTIALTRTGDPTLDLSVRQGETIDGTYERNAAMPKTPKDVRKQAEEGSAKILDLRFVDLPGIWQHFSLPISQLTDDLFEDGIGFDGSSIRGFQHIQESDMLLIADAETAYMDPKRT
jgi:hypothetical protein